MAENILFYFVLHLLVICELNYVNRVNSYGPKLENGGWKHGKYVIFNEYGEEPEEYNVMDGRDKKSMMDHPNFSYNPQSNVGPSQWYRNWPACGGIRQSPINIVTDDLEDVSSDERPLMLGFDNHPTKMEIENELHSVKVTFEWPENRPAIAIGSSTDDTFYVLDHLHFHWGQVSSPGSEHKINGHRYAMECHMVFYNDRYETVTVASDKSDGLVVLSILFSSVPIGRANTVHFMPYLKHIRIPYSKYVIDGGNTCSLNELFDHIDFTDDVVMYDGSLTTPPCYESVKWMLFLKPMPITENTLKEFRKLRQDNVDDWPNNYRPIQPLNGRIVSHVLSE